MSDQPVTTLQHVLTEIATGSAPEQRAIAALDSTNTAARIAEEIAKTSDIVACNDKPGRELVHKAAMRHRDIRLNIQRNSTAAREDAVALQKAVIAEEKRLVGLIQPEEDRLLSIRDGFDADQERIRQEAIEKERQRVAKVTAVIDEYRDIPLQWVGATSRELDAAIESLETASLPELEYKVDEESQVKAARKAASDKLSEMRGAAMDRELAEQRAAEARAAEEARIKAEREAEAKHQAEQRAELERQQAELAAERAKAEAEAKAAREKLEAEAAEQRRQQEATAAAEREAMAKERAALEAERARAAAAQAEQQRLLDEKAAELERQRLEQEESAHQAAAPAPEPAPPVQEAEKLDAEVVGQPPASAPAFAAEPEPADSSLDELHPTDRELVELLVENFGMTAEEADGRLRAYGE